MSVTIPDQRLSALRKANDVRIANARLKNMLANQPSKDGLLHVAAVLHHQDACEPFGAMRISELLTAIHRVGTARAHRWCRQIPVSIDRRVRDMTPREKTAMALLLKRAAA